MKTTSHYPLLKAVYGGQLSYILVLFGWLDKDDIPANDSSPIYCRGILNCGAYSDRMEIKYGKSGGMRADFEFVVDYCNLCLIIKDDKFQEIEARINYLNSIKSSFGIEEDFTLTDLKWDRFAGVPDYTAYKLNGPRKWISSAVPISFFTGIIKYGYNNLAATLGGNGKYTAADFAKLYTKSEFYTDDIVKIKAEFSKNYDQILGYCGTHNWGCANFMEKYSSGLLEKVN